MEKAPDSNRSESAARWAGLREAGRRRAAVAVAGIALMVLSCGDGAVEPLPPSVPTTVAVNPASTAMTSLGETAQFTAEVRDQNGRAMMGTAVAWASSNASVAAVDGSGLVTAAANGSATITATAGSASGTAGVTVAQVVSAVSVSPAVDTLVAFGDTVRLVAEATDANGHGIGGVQFSWSSSDTLVAVVDGGGLVTAAAAGEAEIAAISSGMTGRTALVVTPRVIVSLAVEPARLVSAQAGKQGVDIVVTALDGGGSPVPYARYRWTTDRHSGWVYPQSGATDGQGRFTTTWVAGWPGEGVLSLTVENDVSRVTDELVMSSTVPSNPPNGAVAIWINSKKPIEGYSIEMTPLTEPSGTYYAAIQWDGGYTGLQRGGNRFDRQLQFSVWDAPGHGGAELVDKASDVLCRTFGGEGTGVACELNYPWAVESTYRFEVTEEEMDGGSAMTLHVTDLATESRRFVGTIRFARRAAMTSFAFFVEDFVQRARHCLAREVRSAAIRRPRALLGGEWVAGEWVALDEMQGHLRRWLEDPWNPGTPGCANLAVRQHAAGLELVIGGDTASDPNASPWYTIPRN